jgi:hypothetical protein
MQMQILLEMSEQELLTLREIYLKNMERDSLFDEKGERICTKCGVSKKLDNANFFKLKGGFQGFHPCCKECYNAAERERRKNGAQCRKAVIVDGNKKKCSKCGVFKVNDENNFYKKRKGFLAKCKECTNTKKTPMDVINELVKSCRAADRKNKSLQSDKNTITALDIIDMLIAQRGRCAKYKHPLTFSSEGYCNFKISVDQKKPGLGHSKSNCQLVCAFANVQNNGREA